MTYCLGIILPAGLVLASDSRSSAGVDQLAVVRKVGARGLRSILEVLLAKVQLDIGEYKGKTIVIDNVVEFLEHGPSCAPTQMVV